MDGFVDRLLNYWSESYYTQVIVIGSSLYSLITISRSNGEVAASLFKAYLISVLFLFLTGDIAFAIGSFDNNTVALYIETCNNIFNLVEAVAFLLFLNLIITNKHFKTFNYFLLFSSLAIAIITAGTIFILPPAGRFASITFSTVIHLYIVIIPCLYYFYETYKLNRPLEIRHTIKVYFILSYALISIPFFALGTNFLLLELAQPQFVSLHHLFLSFLCLSLSFNRIKFIPS